MTRLTHRGWFRLQALGATATFLAGVLTLLVPDWMEVVIRLEPDGGNGSLELLIVLACFVATAALSLLARSSYRRIASASD
jgi:hypothetical protein